MFPTATRWFTSFALGAMLIAPDAPCGEGAKISNLKFSHERGFYSAAFELSISPKTPGRPVYFTTNGAAPSPASGQLYQGPIVVRSTTVLRAAAFQEGGKTSVTAAQTYIFPHSVLQQTGAGFPAAWGLNEGKLVSADYEMDPEIVNHSAYRGVLEDALKSIPTISIAMNQGDLFDPKRGIYSNPKESGEEWERPASAELISANERQGFQIDCGIRIQGGWNRRPEESPKHSFRLLFKKKYGAGKLRFPLFGDGVTEFDTLILRGGCNNTWLHWSGEERRRGDYLRDQWIRDSYRAMEHPSARGRFVHLYLNGLYWGLYNVVERPSAPFVAAHFGGAPEDYDVRNGDHILEGDGAAWEKMMTLANAGLKGEAEFRAMQEWLEIPAFIDYLIVNLYGANADWDRASNWYAARRRTPPGRFHFFVWDAERTLEGVNDNTISFDDDQSPPRLFQKLRENAEFRRQFAERAQRHLSNGGALTAERAAERFRVLAGPLDKAIVAESARWGDYRRDVHPYKVGPYELYTRDEHWRPEIDRLFKEYFPKRAEAVAKQFRSAGF